MVLTSTISVKKILIILINFDKQVSMRLDDEDTGKRSPEKYLVVFTNSKRHREFAMPYLQTGDSVFPFYA